MEEAHVPAVLSIAGSDSGGGAGIQADLKAFARCGVHGMTAITAITAQSTVGVEAIHAVPPEMIVAQVRAVADDIGVDAVKIGMLGTADTVCAVRDALEYVGGAPIVIDPVMVAESGAVLLDDAARQAIVDELLPLAAVITPNLPEARVLAGEATGRRTRRQLARALHALGPAAVVVTGGHRDEATDVFFDGEELHADPRRAPRRRRRARLRLHALVRAGRPPGARASRPLEAATGGAPDRGRRRPRRPARDRRRRRPGRRLRPDRGRRNRRAFGAPARSPAARRVT